MDFNQVIFKDKTFSSLLEDIYKNANRKEKEIKMPIADSVYKILYENKNPKKLMAKLTSKLN